MGPFIVGILLGYLLNKNNKSPIKLNNVTIIKRLSI